MYLETEGVVVERIVILYYGKKKCIKFLEKYMKIHFLSLDIFDKRKIEAVE